MRSHRGRGSEGGTRNASSLAASMLLSLVGCAPAQPGDLVDFAPLRPGVCEEGALPCDAEGRALVFAPEDFAEDLTLRFVIDALSIPRADADGRAPGFDLDGILSPGSDAEDASCAVRHADVASSVDPGLVGVDDQIRTILPTIEGLLACDDGPVEGCFDRRIAEDIAAGEALWLVEVAEVRSFMHDPRVVVRILEGSPGRGGLTLGPDGRLAAGQALRARPALEAVGTLLDGRVDARFEGRLPLRFADLSLTLTDPRVRFDLAEAGLARGVLGGVNVVETPHGPDETICSVLDEVADMPIAGICAGGCGGVSVGATFTAVPASWP